MRVIWIRVFAHERVRIKVLIQVPKRVIDLSMLRLVGPHIVDQIPHHPVSLGQLPVVNCNLRRLHVLPQGQFASLEISDAMRVCYDCLLLKVADESVAGLGRDEIGEEERVEEDALGAEQHEAHEDAGTAERQERQKMHAFVESFLKERLDPVSSVSLFTISSSCPRRTSHYLS